MDAAADGQQGAAVAEAGEEVVSPVRGQVFWALPIAVPNVA